MKNDFSKLGGCNACALRASGECKITAILHCDFFKPFSRPTQYALDAAMPPSAEPDSDLESVPAVESSSQPRK